MSPHLASFIFIYYFKYILISINLKDILSKNSVLKERTKTKKQAYPKSKLLARKAKERNMGEEGDRESVQEE